MSSVVVSRDASLPEHLGGDSPVALRTLARVLLVEPNTVLRSAIETVLQAEDYQVEACESLDEAVHRADERAQVIALVAWQSMEGLLAEERRHHLGELTKRLRLVLMVPRRWTRLLDQTDLGTYVNGLIAKPFEAD